MWDGIALSVLVVMLRTSNRHNGMNDGGWTGDEMDFADWMTEHGLVPGDPGVKDFFER